MGRADTVLGNFPADGFPPDFPHMGTAISAAWSGSKATLKSSRSGRVQIHAGRSFAVPDQRVRARCANREWSGPGCCETLVVNGQWWPRPYSEATLEVFERDGGVVLTHTGFARATSVAGQCRQIRRAMGDLRS